MENIGLVLEGGGMRGLYTAGVLEYFLEKDLFFPYVIGVSAGACMAASYLSKQIGRNKKVNIGLANDPRYVSFRNFLLKREIFGMDFLFDEIPNKIIPFDFDAFTSGPEQFIVGTTDCHTGKAIYYNKHDHGNDMLKIIRASSSLPFLAPVVEYNGKELLDGGIIDPIPLNKSKEDGNIKNVIIMTKDNYFIRKPSKYSKALKYMFSSHPKIAEVLINRHIIYNDTLKQLDMAKQNGTAFIIQPSIPLPVSRIERNQSRLTKLYELGYEDAKNKFEELKQFIEK